MYAGINYSLYFARYERVLLRGPLYGPNGAINQLEATDGQRDLVMIPKAGVRYYYAMAGRVKRGTSANNFSGNYVSIQAERYITDTSHRSYYNLVTGDPRTGIDSYLNKRPIFSLFWGFQRRLGRLGYIDLSAGPSFRPPKTTNPLPSTSYATQIPTGKSLSLQINALIGLGW